MAARDGGLALVIDDPEVAVVAFLALVLGEVWRVASPGLVRDAPLAQATAIAVTLAWDWPEGPVGPPLGVLGPFAGALGPMLLAVLATLAVGVGRRHWRSLPGDLLRSVLTVGVVGFFTRLPLPTGLTLHEHATGDPGAQRGLVACFLLVVALAAVAAPVVVGTLARVSEEHAPLRSLVLTDLRRHGLLALATATTGVVTALAVHVLGPVSFLLFLVPMTVLLPAVTRQRQIRAAQRQTMFALARLTDQAGLTAPGHAARVARLAVPVAREAGVEDADLLDVETAALLHDVGQVGLSRPIPGGATIEISALDQRRVAATGAAILARTADLSRLAPVVADVGIPHHRAVARGDVALASRVVRVVSAYDDLSASLEHQGALERILRSTPHDYDPLVVGALVRHLERRGTVSAAEGALLRELASDRPGPT
ncbi:HD-GYP domain-containing protein [Ornithinimicrobium cerasi]|uniref:HD-GYP domain-containing protein n=1 Tax=Ornithinimicrobium cerasi TaxID=2248773 RepID=UPI000BE3F660|nr:HD domain-containing protein [Ornithinimicrobium cerasi]